MFWKRLRPAPLAAALAIGITAPFFLVLVRRWGWRIPQPAIEADYAVGLAWATILLVLLFFVPIPKRDRFALIGLWILRCFLTLGFMLVYEWNYSLDSYSYFLWRQVLEPPIGDMFFERDAGNAFMATFSWYHNRILPTSYHAMKVTCAMVGLIAVYLFYRSAVLLRGVEDRRMLYLLGLFPSVLFWSSILGKEPFMMLAVAAYVYGVARWFRGWHLLGTLCIGAGVALACIIRLWMAPILLIPFAVLGMMKIRSRVGKIATFAGAGAVVYFLAMAFLDAWALDNLQAVVERADRLSEGWEGGSALTRTVSFTSPGAIVKFLPYGMVTAIFRPLPGEVMNPFGLLAGLENLVLVVLTVVALSQMRLQDFKQPLVVWALLVVVLWAGLYSVVSVNNLGAAVRFKLQILPILLGLLFAGTFKAHLESGDSLQSATVSR